MQLHSAFRFYDALRRAHDAEIMQVAMETGLRISPDQWSSLLYGDVAHKSQMQSIIDKVNVCHCYVFDLWFLNDYPHAYCCCSPYIHYITTIYIYVNL